MARVDVEATAMEVDGGLEVALVPEAAGLLAVSRSRRGATECPGNAANFLQERLSAVFPARKCRGSPYARQDVLDE